MKTNIYQRAMQAQPNYTPTPQARGMLEKLFFKLAHCPLCKYEGAPVRFGWSFSSVLFLLLLLFCFLVPGLVYLVYRSNKASVLVCGRCGCDHIIRI